MDLKMIVMTDERYVVDEDNSVVLSGDNRNTNQCILTSQYKGTCYAHAASSAYYNTVSRIYGCTPPKMKDLLNTAIYSHNGGSVGTALTRLENKFKMGVRFRIQRAEPKQEDILKLSVIVSFTTTKQGWRDISGGKHLKKYEGENDGYHASLIEGYDFKRGNAICKNSWGLNNFGGRFRANLSSLQDTHFHVVYFTMSSLPHHIPRLPPNGIRAKGLTNFRGCNVHSVYMTDIEAKYNSDYISIGRVNVGNYRHIGIKLDVYVRIKNRERTREIISSVASVVSGAVIDCTVM